MFAISTVYGQSKPNIVLVMADDLGWGDVGFNGNPFIKTPELDLMATKSIQFTRFYAASAVCSPTRGSCLTGRNPERYGIHFANDGSLNAKEITLAEVLKQHGYMTGHFGKWHLGTLSKTIPDGNRGGKEKEIAYYSPPWENGFDTCFSTEQAVPTWNPMKEQTIKTKYWVGPGKFATENLEGDDSRIIMDRALTFIKHAVKKRSPFLSVIWFHTPHTPVVAGPQYLAMYPGFDENRQHYFGCITAMDEQIGRLRRELKLLGIAENTIIFFASDNGPAGEGGGILQYAGQRQQGSAGLFRGRKGSLYEGGIRVPALLEWPAGFKTHRRFDVPTSTSDYFPSIMSLLGYNPEGKKHPLDGINILELIKQGHQKRSEPIGFRLYKQRAYIDDQYKIYSFDDGMHYELYDLLNDPYEKSDIANSQPDRVDAMKTSLETWIDSCIKSEQGEDY